MARRASRGRRSSFSGWSRQRKPLRNGDGLGGSAGAYSRCDRWIPRRRRAATPHSVSGRFSSPTPAATPTSPRSMATRQRPSSPSSSPQLREVVEGHGGSVLELREARPSQSPGRLMSPPGRAARLRRRPAQRRQAGRVAKDFENPWDAARDQTTPIDILDGCRGTYEADPANFLRSLVLRGTSDARLAS
jgi:hypothetical protein